ncbi:hypothetical protein Bbelb_084650 [Branchiostoma belcheri]|nr:hypothetical protein Bbelb_084650 [Branchiostoma belcheri]
MEEAERKKAKAVVALPRYASLGRLHSFEKLQADKAIAPSGRQTIFTSKKAQLHVYNQERRDQLEGNEKRFGAQDMGRDKERFEKLCQTLSMLSLKTGAHKAVPAVPFHAVSRSASPDFSIDVSTGRLPKSHGGNKQPPVGISDHEEADTRTFRHPRSGAKNVQRRRRLRRIVRGRHVLGRNPAIFAAAIAIAGGGPVDRGIWRPDPAGVREPTTERVREGGPGNQARDKSWSNRSPLRSGTVNRTYASSNLLPQPPAAAGLSEND